MGQCRSRASVLPGEFTWREAWLPRPKSTTYYLCDLGQNSLSESQHLPLLNGDEIIPISKHVGGLIETLSEKHLAQCYAYSRCSINATLQRREMAYSMNTVQKVAFGRGGEAAAKLSQV